MELNIRLAKPEEYGSVRAFYHSLIDSMKDMEFHPAWKKDIYPSPEVLLDSLQNNELYMGETDSQTVSCMVINHKYNKGYAKAKWSVDADDAELLVIHILGVHSSFSGKGIAKQMLQKAIDLAKETGIKTIRLDVLEGNVPAERAYVKMGFQYVETLQMFYEDTGLTNFRLFEFIV